MSVLHALKNKNLNGLNLHFGLHFFAEEIGSIFGPIYLYQAGFDLPLVFGVWAGGHVLRFLFRPIMLHFLPAIGLRKSVILGSIFFAGLYPLLMLVEGNNIWLWVFMIAVALCDVAYWFPYHVYFTELSNRESQGKQVAIREIFVQLFRAFALLLGGVLIFAEGYGVTFWLAGGMFLLSALPLLFLKDIPLSNIVSFKDAWKTVSKKGSLIYGIEAAIHVTGTFTWVLVLFLFFQNTASMGLLLMLVVLIKLGISYFVGHCFDVQKRKYFYLLGGLLAFVAVLGRTFWAYTALFILFFDTLYAFSKAITGTWSNSIVYQASRESNQTVWFQFFAETGWDIGVTVMSVLVIISLYLGLSIQMALLFSLITIPVLLFILRPRKEL